MIKKCNEEGSEMEKSGIERKVDRFSVVRRRFEQNSTNNAAIHSKDIAEANNHNAEKHKTLERLQQHKTEIHRGACGGRQNDKTDFAASDNEPHAVSMDPVESSSSISCSDVADVTTPCAVTVTQGSKTQTFGAKKATKPPVPKKPPRQTLTSANSKQKETQDINTTNTQAQSGDVSLVNQDEKDLNLDTDFCESTDVPEQSLLEAIFSATDSFCAKNVTTDSDSKRDSGKGSSTTTVNTVEDDQQRVTASQLWRLLRNTVRASAAVSRHYSERTTDHRPSILLENKHWSTPARPQTEDDDASIYDYVEPQEWTRPEKTAAPEPPFRPTQLPKLKPTTPTSSPRLSRPPPPPHPPPRRKSRNRSNTAGSKSGEVEQRHRSTSSPLSPESNLAEDTATDREIPDYIEVLGDSKRSSRFGEEPLYQIYQLRLRQDTLDENENETNEETTSLRSEITRTSGGRRTLWREMVEVKKSNYLADLSSTEVQQQEAWFEILTSEASYLRSLNLLLEVFVNSPEFGDMKLIEKHDKKSLFNNVHLVQAVSERFLVALESHWATSCLLSTNFCDVIDEFLSNSTFDVYVSYVSNQNYQEKTLARLKSNNALFRDVIIRLEQDPRCQQLSIFSFLSLPMQRITRLPLLLAAVTDKLEKSEDKKKASNTLNKLQKLVQRCNEGARQMGNLEKITEIEKKLKFLNMRKFPIVSSTRSFVKDGQLIKVQKEQSYNLLFVLKKLEYYHLFLFNDYLFITKKKSDEEYVVVDYCLRNCVHCDPITDSNAQKFLPSGINQAHKDKFLFAVVFLENYDKKCNLEYILAATSLNEQARWIEAISPPKSQNTDEKIYESWDCPQVQVMKEYTAQQPDELSLSFSDVINVSRKMADGWYQGERMNDGEVGWFPAKYVKEVLSEHQRARNLRMRYRLLQYLS